MTTSWLPPDFGNILPELKAVPNWVLTKPVVRGGKATKPPLQPNGHPASHSDPATWSSFDAVVEAYRSGSFKAVGYVLDGKPHFGGLYLHGFDWDDCVAKGKTDPAVLKKLKELGIPRIEVSVSGRGIRGFFLHYQPLPSRRTRIDGRSVELYSDKRYLTTTGHGRGALI